MLRHLRERRGVGLASAEAESRALMGRPASAEAARGRLGIQAAAHAQGLF